MRRFSPGTMMRPVRECVDGVFVLYTEASEIERQRDEYESKYRETLDRLKSLESVEKAARAYMSHKYPNGDQSSVLTFSMELPKLTNDLLDALSQHSSKPSRGHQS